ncbi:lef-8 [Sucra jujuba nucleopolyhedrovirus]|uniref:DNA-directed RNA polymerase n=1 Tax=Sucra jujuba nucleopolyhedrovirus TaxID=1563660 RepID=A0A097P8W5_9ABAC|nr:lef-8 [Sucra jujuba nucleopolyhedrovirus]AIU41272.1 lef-8 [Sucra jujuba nucleopolyhedrovirus]
MTDVIKDFNNLYAELEQKYCLQFFLNCADKQDNETSLKCLQERKSYLCCAVDSCGRCVLHKCVPVIFGTTLDAKFRAGDGKSVTDILGTFMIDGRNLSFPNIMMNNNILIHNFYDKQYSKSCKRMFLYGNMDEEKKINRAIQLVYDKHEDVLLARDVYAREYVVTQDLNTVLDLYLQRSGKWEPLNFLFNYSPYQTKTLVEQIKKIMKVDINYSIDSLANKIIYKHDYLLSLCFRSVLKQYEALKMQEENGSDSKNLSHGPVKRKKLQTVLYPKECKKIVETIVNGKLIYTVSKTFSKQRKNFIVYQDNSSNNNIEINTPLLKYRVGNEVVRITNDTMRQNMLMQKNDFVKYVDSFFHGEMTVAGKKFFLCRNVRLPAVNYETIKSKFEELLHEKLIRPLTENDLEQLNDDDNDNAAANTPDNCSNNNTNCEKPAVLRITFNDRPTIYCCERADLYKIFYYVKRNMCPIEMKLNSNILFVNHHEGMICLKRTVRITKANVTIAVLLTPYEYHNNEALLRITDDIGVVEENDTVTCLMSKLVQYYYKNYTNIFRTVPVPKLIVSLTNLKNAMPVITYSEGYNFVDDLPQGNSVIVAPHIRMNNKMFKLWTLVRDHRLMTAEDPYIPDNKLPIRLFNNKINKLKGKLVYGKNETPSVKFNASENFNCINVAGGNVLHMAGVIVSNVKIAWIYDGKRYKIETCRNKNFYVFKIYVYFRQLLNQTVEKINSVLNVFNDTVYLKLTMVTSTNDLQGVKICGIHGQKGVMNGSEDLTEWMSEDGTCAQICLSPISFLSRQSNFDDVEKKYVVRGGCFNDPAAKRFPIFNIPYMFFNNTPDNIYKEFIKTNHTGHEKIEGTRLDQWTINQSFAGNRMAESLQCIRGSTNLPDNSGEFHVMSSLMHCNNTIML